jgi:ERCC4-type nuclease
MEHAQSSRLFEQYKDLLKEYFKWFYLITKQQQKRCELIKKPYRGPQSWLKTDLDLAQMKYAELRRFATALGLSKEQADLHESEARVNVRDGLASEQGGV